jgi:hypothetical protein
VCEQTYIKTHARLIYTHLQMTAGAIRRPAMKCRRRPSRCPRCCGNHRRTSSGCEATTHGTIFTRSSAHVRAPWMGYSTTRSFSLAENYVGKGIDLHAKLATSSFFLCMNCMHGLLCFHAYVTLIHTYIHSASIPEGLFDLSSITRFSPRKIPSTVQGMCMYVYMCMCVYVCMYS